MRTLILIGLLSTAAGCTSDQTMRYDGVTWGAGDAIAANTAMQMVDPWQPGVQDTRLLVQPAAPAKAAATGAAADGGASVSSSAAPSD